MSRTYRGRAIEVTFDLGKCIHVGECLRGLPDVFELRRRPWIAPDAAEPDEVAEIVERCPSGALTYRRLDGGPNEQHDGVSMVPMRNGPLRVVGEIRVVGPDGSEDLLPRATLCRCGQSANKPWCDNSHLRVGFHAPGEPFRIRLSPVRPAVTAPMATADDPRGRDG